ncbi:hypothetical protein FUA23_06635 [Neolewinella aurantiaca]|uniref:Uncharacterized protein n=1 Tax=Neolewinella aurantiaca TaxID=2602767 RepID=A0A5C7FHB2_9BACT|nr:hypothetical protein [Neolewinella aurantiaca]TXF90458.1 hypothetical protein FUA23_06635 [Neolewinella aurantiaca]
MKLIQCIKYGLGVAAIATLTWSCEDPNETFEPTNPNLSSDNVLGTIESSARLLNGTERQLALTMNEIVAPMEIATDNYENTQTFFNQFLDDLAIDPTDRDIEEIQYSIARLRELASAGINDIVPADEGSTDEQLAGFYMLRGVAYLLGGELFTTLPGEPMGPALPATDHLNAAIADFSAAMDLGSNQYSEGALIGRARAYYRLGNKSAAVADATLAIANTPAYVYFARYDGVQGPGNVMQDALWDRGSFDDLQPLPTMDFLDPKYNGATPNVEVNIPLLKIEEAHLILAEAALSDGSLDDAKQIMKNIVGLVATRPVDTFNDGVEGRTQDFPGSRPDNSSIMVAAGPDLPLMSGLVIDRGAEDVTIPTVSGTHYTEDEIDAIDDIDFAYESLYRMRQEIFFAEGRRVTDLGIRLVVSLTEKVGNPNITDADLEPTIPSWLEPIKAEFDAFTYDTGAETATVTNNLNRLISENRGSDLIAPFE